MHKHIHMHIHIQVVGLMVSTYLAMSQQFRNGPNGGFFHKINTLHYLQGITKKLRMIMIQKMYTLVPVAAWKEPPTQKSEMEDSQTDYQIYPPLPSMKTRFENRELYHPFHLFENQEIRKSGELGANPTSHTTSQTRKWVIYKNLTLQSRKSDDLQKFNLSN